jgi:flavodoxin I
MKMAIVYSSRTGNTEELVQDLYELFLSRFVKVELYTVEQFWLDRLAEYDAVVIGTYTWGDGEIPPEMILLYEAFENQNVKHILTGVVGTGDRFYPHFCGAVDEFRDMLHFQTDLAVTLKVELSPQQSDKERCTKFVELILRRMKKNQSNMCISLGMN